MRRKGTRILGLDPGFARTGYAILEREGHEVRVVTYGCIETHAREKYSLRLLRLENQLVALVARYRPTLVAMERLFFCKNVKTALEVGQARGVLLVVLARKKLIPFELTPQEVKLSATGYGNANKAQVQRMVQVILRLPTIPQPDDAADALAIALAASNTRQAHNEKR